MRYRANKRVFFNLLLGLFCWYAILKKKQNFRTTGHMFLKCCNKSLSDHMTLKSLEKYLTLQTFCKLLHKDKFVLFCSIY